MIPLLKMRCGECGHRGLELSNLKGEYRTPWKDFPSVLVTRDIELPKCPSCGEVSYNGAMGEALDEALEASVREHVSSLLEQVQAKTGLTARRLSQILGVTPEYLSMLLKGKKTGSYQIAQMLRVLCLKPELVADLERPYSSIGSLASQTAAR